MNEIHECRACLESFGSSRERKHYVETEHPNHPMYRQSRLLSDEEAFAIRAYFPKIAEPDGELAIQVANEFQVNVQTVINIATGKSYRRPSACPPGHPLQVALNAELAAKQRTRSKVTSAMRKRLRDAQNGKCAYCLQEFGGKVRAHADHITPIVQGGKSESANLQLLCSRCNQSKGGRGDDEYRRVVVIRVTNERNSMLIGEARCLDHNDECPLTCPYSQEYEGNVFQALWFMMDMRQRRREREQAFADCPCAHYGCPPDCMGCPVCSHDPGKPKVVVCPMDEYGGTTPCTRKCQGECLNWKDFQDNDY